MEKRAVIAVVISISILLLFQYVIFPRFQPPAEEGNTEAPFAEPTTTSPPAEAEAPALAAAAPPQPNSAAAEARRVTVDTDLYTATFTTNGARLESFRLKKYLTTVAPDSPFQETVIPGEHGELPFGVELRGGQTTPVVTDAGAPYSVEGDGLDLRADEQGSLDFVWRSASGTIRKHFTFTGGRYEFAAQLSVTSFPKEYNELSAEWIKGVDVPPQPGSEIIFDRAVFLDGRKLIEDTFDKLSGGKILPGDIAWAGYAGRHFFAAMVPTAGQSHRVWLKLRDHTVEEKILFPLVADPAEQHLDVYIGPKDFDSLELLGHSLSRVVNLGWFGFIAVPLMHLLKFFHGFTANYGLDIILMTVLIKILFIPLTQRSFQSMRAMQKLQPQMAKIRERFKDNQEQMNKEIMELYRRHKVNPVGGCLPMVLQIPVFIGLYSALGNAVELRHAPFLLWINDLSAPDRLGLLQLPFVQHPGIPVLTLLMGVSMFVQQWMTPSAGDPTQQQVMMIMPLMFTFMFVNFPSGLALYWLVNNLLTIAQQYYMNRTST